MGGHQAGSELSGAHAVSLRRPNLLRANQPATPHTLRHKFGSVAGDLGFSELTIAALLGHAARSVTQGYIHIDEALKLAATRICKEIDLLLNGTFD